jgi:hypothetical protein
VSYGPPKFAHRPAHDERRKYLKNLMESPMRMLQAITNGEGNHIKY